MTIVWFSALIVPLTSLPDRSRTVYWNVVVISSSSSSPAGEPVEVFDRVALLESRLVGDPAALDELGKVLVHRVHAVPGASLKRRVDLVRLTLADQVPDRGGGDEHFGGDGATTTVGGLAQCLADDALQRAGELHPDLLLLVGREHVDDAVDRLGGVLGVQGGEDEVAGLGGGERYRDGLQVPHLTDEDDVGVLPQHVLEGVPEGVRVLADLALVDHAGLVPVQELDRVLD